MRSAPSVSYPVGRSRFGAGCLAAAWLAGLATGLAWLAPGSVAGWRAAVWAGVVAGCAVWAWRWWAAQTHGRLRWDGAAWQWQAGPGAAHAPGAKGPVATDQALTLTVALDLQRVLLVRCVPAGVSPACPRWLWLEAGADAALWRALRRAVYSRAPHAPQAQPQGGASHP